MRLDEGYSVNGKDFITINNPNVVEGIKRWLSPFIEDIVLVQSCGKYGASMSEGKLKHVSYSKSEYSYAGERYHGLAITIQLEPTKEKEFIFGSHEAGRRIARVVVHKHSCYPCQEYSRKDSLAPELLRNIIVFENVDALVSWYECYRIGRTNFSKQFFEYMCLKYGLKSGWLFNKSSSRKF